MLKKIISAVFVASILAAPASVLADNKPVVAKVNVAMLGDNLLGESDKSNVKARASNENRDQNADLNNSTTPATGWILSFALLGFVLLSNRSGV